MSGSIDKPNLRDFLYPLAWYLRNLSAINGQSRNRLRHCDGLVDAQFIILRAAIGQPDIDNKCVENCACTLRNLCYACQEEVDPNYLLRREHYRQHTTGKGNKSGSKLCGCSRLLRQRILCGESSVCHLGCLWTVVCCTIMDVKKT